MERQTENSHCFYIYTHQPDLESRSQGSGCVFQRSLHQVVYISYGTMSCKSPYNDRGTFAFLSSVSIKQCTTNQVDSMMKSGLLRRQKFLTVRKKCTSLVVGLEKMGPEASIDMDNAGMRLALDVVALVRQALYNTYFCFSLMTFRS